MPGLLLFPSTLLSSSLHVKSLLLAACLIAAWLFPKIGDRFFAAIENFGARLADRKTLAIVAIAAAVIVLRLSLLPILPPPLPEAQDEFGYLLSADTFAHGRLTNPPHPLWQFFDTFQVNQQPTYQSRYPPAQGAVLALGQLLGNPWIGVVLSVAAMCAATLWALQGWLPPVWALIGASLIAIRIGTFNYWMNGYWGGAVAAMGGALVIGALPRILRVENPKDRRSRDAWLLGIGIAILANSRPVEGFVFCIPVAVVLGIHLFRTRTDWHTNFKRVISPIAVCIIATCAFTAYYNWRVTGNALVPPFVLNQRTYFRGQPVFFWQNKLPPTHTGNPQFDSYYNIFPGGFDGSWRGRVFVTWRKFVKFRDFFLFTESALLVPLLALPWLLRKKWWPLIAAIVFCGMLATIVFVFARPYTLPVASTLPMLGLLWLLHDDEMRFLVIELMVCFAGLLLVIAFLEHYAAPLTAVFFILLMQAMRYLRGWRHADRPVGIGLSRVVVLFVVGMFPVLVAQQIRQPNSVPPVMPEWALARARIESQLEATPGEHLIIVRYSPQHTYDTEVVYNLADIDHSKVIWSRELPGVDIHPLLRYFSRRHIWLLEPDVSPELKPYPAAP